MFQNKVGHTLQFPLPFLHPFHSWFPSSFLFFSLLPPLFVLGTFSQHLLMSSCHCCCFPNLFLVNFPLYNRSSTFWYHISAFGITFSINYWLYHLPARQSQSLFVTSSTSLLGACVESIFHVLMYSVTALIIFVPSWIAFVSEFLACLPLVSWRNLPYALLHHLFLLLFPLHLLLRRYNFHLPFFFHTILL